MIKTAAWGAPAAKVPLEPMTIQRRDVGPRDVLIDIKYCGVCHSDLHQVEDHWGPGLYPMVPGHEITGVVTAVGAEVTRFTAGNRVGVGTLIGSCGKCDACVAGLEVYCVKGPIPTYNAQDGHGDIAQGGYSAAIVVDEHFVLRIPNVLPLDTAAPLLCAGITTYSPLRHWRVGPGMRVGIVGMGGLGHLAVQFAHAMGAEVTVLSRTSSKQEDGLRLGADHYYATEDPATFEALAGTFDLILCTVSSTLPFDSYLQTLTLDGTFVNVGAPEDPITLSNWSMISGRRSYAASASGGIAETQEMLDFAADHRIEASIELIDVKQIQEAFDRMQRADVRYRFVIDNSISY